jgi:sulfate permease, SulP family
VTGAAIAAAPDPRQAATTLAFYCSIFLIAWVLRLGYVADLISAPVLTGFKIGIGISIVVGQLDSLLGVSIEDDRVAQQL